MSDLVHTVEAVESESGREVAPSLLWPVYEFRPAPDVLRRGYPVFRYADGQWLPDDGEYDLAFCSWLTCLYVELPYQRNIVWKGLTTHWTGYQPKHPRGNPWHIALRADASEWGGPWNRYPHPNEAAGRSGMSWTCARYRSASGLHVAFEEGDPHIAAGLVRERSTKAVLRAPARLSCMYCGSDWQEAARPDGASSRHTQTAAATGSDPLPSPTPNQKEKRL